MPYTCVPPPTPHVFSRSFPCCLSVCCFLFVSVSMINSQFLFALLIPHVFCFSCKVAFRPEFLCSTFSWSKVFWSPVCSLSFTRDIKTVKTKQGREKKATSLGFCYSSTCNFRITASKHSSQLYMFIHSVLVFTAWYMLASFIFQQFAISH